MIGWMALFVIQSQGVFFLRLLLKRFHFEDMLIPLAIVASDLTAGASVVFKDKGDVMMPIRRRTRQQDRVRRIDAERALNAAHVAERNQPPPF